MNFMFEWQEQCLTSERSERVRYCSCQENIKVILEMYLRAFFFFKLFSQGGPFSNEADIQRGPGLKKKRYKISL